MLESFFSRFFPVYGPAPWVAPYLSELAAQLLQQHYARRTCCILLRTADRLHP